MLTRPFRVLLRRWSQEGDLPIIRQSNMKAGLVLGIKSQMGALDGAGEVIAIFGDFQRGYRILDGKGVSIQRLSELYAEAGVSWVQGSRTGGWLSYPTSQQDHNPAY